MNSSDRSALPGPPSACLAPFPLIALIGPTAVGKTELSLRLAEELRGEIVNMDSVQIYRKLDIGTAKATQEERKRVPHHLIDVADPDEPFDAADYVRSASAIIRSILSRGRIPLLTGGTGLYLRALLAGLAPCPGQDPLLRARLRSIAREQGRQVLHRELERADPETAARLHPNDVMRVIRAIEVYEVSGKPLSYWHRKGGRNTLPFGRDCVKIGLMRSREELYERIDRRVDVMLKAGLIEEVRGLLDQGYSRKLKSLQSLGYRHMIEFLSGELSIEEAVRQLKRDTRHYAKRQLTWFRADPRIRWFHPEWLKRRNELWPAIVGGSAEL